MSKANLTYFKLTGLAEPSRFLLVYTVIEYDDVRINHEESKDLTKCTNAAVQETNQDINKLTRETIISEIIPSYVEKLEALVVQNNGYFALGRLTWADLYFAALEEQFMYVKPNFFDAAPKLNELVQRLKNISSIKRWIEARLQNSL